MCKRRHTKRLPSFLDRALTPARSTLAHLILIGIPVLWGITPLWDDGSIHPWMGPHDGNGRKHSFWKKGVYYSRYAASTMFNDHILSAQGTFSSSLEAFAVHDMGWNFLYPYELSFVALFLLVRHPPHHQYSKDDDRSETAMQHFQETLNMCSIATLLFLAVLQSIHPKWSFPPLEPNFFARMILCHLLAVSISWGSLSWRATRNAETFVPTTYNDQDWRAKSARWSIPGIALISGAIVSGLLVVASIQALFQEHGMQNYFGDDPSVESEIFLTSFWLGTFHVATHAFLLYRLRYNIMDVGQLKYLCLYKFVVHSVAPLLWLPEFNPNVHVDKRVTLGTRLFLAFIYWSGYHFAGLGDSVGRILVGEKGD